jgi:hypothetical protein
MPVEKPTPPQIEQNKLKFSEDVPIRQEGGVKEPTDPLSFLLKWRHLDAKKVKFETPDGEVSGTVKGLVTPNVIVETDLGYVVKVDPNKLKV